MLGSQLLIYGMFPFFLILMFTPAAGKALMFYLKALFWLQLWAPLYALLNLIMVSYSANTGIAVATLATGGQELTLATTTALGAVNADIASIASYMAWMIPLISWGVVNAGAGMSMSMLASGLGAITQQAGARAAAEVSQGNLSMGNTGMYNQNSFATNMAPSDAGSTGGLVDHRGTTHTMTPSGGDYENPLKHSLGASTTMTSAMKSGTQTQAAEMVAATRNEFSEYGSMVQASNQQMENFMSQVSSDVSTSNAWRSDEMASAQKEFSETQRLQSQFGESRGYTANQSAALMGMAALSANEPGLIAAVSPIGLKAQLGIEGKSTAQISQDFTDAVQFVKDNNYGEQWRESESAVNSAAAQVAQATNDSSATSVNSALSEQSSHADRVQASLQESQNWQTAASRVNEESFAFSADTSGALLDFMRSRHGESDVSDMLASHNQGNNKLPRSKLSRLALDFHFVEAGYYTASYKRLRAQTKNLRSKLRGIKPEEIQATQFIATEAADFAKSHGLVLAGVQDAPSPTEVTSSGQQYMNDVNAQSNEVTNTAQSNSDSIQNKVSHSGLPADTDINSEALNVMYESDLQFLDVGKKIDQNESSMSTMGQWIEDNSRHKSDPQHSTVLADAVGNGITQVLPSQSQMEGIKESGKKLVNGFFD